ncbi:MAG: prepilin peptidase [Lachnospiraceae bacterium]|nr:prepilin peptidase [Lachnospiraceae bacterium]
MTKTDILAISCIATSLTIFSIIDIRRRSINIAAIIVFLALMVVLAILGPNDVKRILLGIIPGAVTVLLAIASRGKVGIGDGIILSGIGLWCGLQETLSIYFVSLLICSAVGVFMMIGKKASIKTELPFLPFLLVGYLACTVSKGLLKIV